MTLQSFSLDNIVRFIYHYKVIKIIKNFKNIIYRYRAIFFILGLAFASIIGVIHLFNISNSHNVKLITQCSIKNAQKAFKDLEINTGNMLSAALEALLINEEIAFHFSKRNRNPLYRLCRPLFEKIKEQNSITHWYFLNPEPGKTCFLRIHTPHIYNDTITRVTLDTCIKTKELVLGKELGKTALALRAVHPYFHKGHLLGYMELAVEMEYFFNVLKQQTDIEYGLAIRKEFLDESKWASVTKEKKIQNNWNDMEQLLLVNKTSDALHLRRFQKQLENPGRTSDEGIVLEMLTDKKRHFIRGIFPFYDSAKRKVGGVFIQKDITPIFIAMQKQKSEIVTMLLGFMGVITLFMIFFHKQGERELKEYRNRLEELVEERTVKLLEINNRLIMEIENHKQDQVALEEECKAREKAEKKQVEAVKQMERSARLASLGVMAAGITHEINQPLNAIKVTAESIQYWHKRNAGVLPEMFTEQLNIISKSVKRIVEIIQHMRTFWVVPHAPGLTEVDINKAVKNALSLTRQQIHAHGIQERVNLDTEPVMVEGNMVHFEQIIVNLLVNAIYALDEKDRGDKEIKITTRREEQGVELTIEDNGPGLPTEDPGKLFDPFFSTRSSGKGMGLGLAIVKRYIDRYDGTIDARNNAKTGTVITIRFPFSENTGNKNENTAYR